MYVHAGTHFCIPVVLSMSCPLTHLCWHALCTLMQFVGMCVWHSVAQRMCIDTGCAYLCIQIQGSCCTPPVTKLSLRSVVAPNSPSGLTGTQALDVRQSPPRLEGLLCYVCLINFLFSFSFFPCFPLFYLVSHICFFFGWQTDVDQLQGLPWLQHSSRSHSSTWKPDNSCSMKHKQKSAHPVFWLSRC